MPVVYCTYPPQANLAEFGLALTCTMLPLPQDRPASLAFAPMLGVGDYPGEHWRAKIRTRVEANNVDDPANKGFYTIGLATCYGLGMSFMGPAQRQVSLAHLSNEVADVPASIQVIVNFMLEEGQIAGRTLQRVVILVHDETGDQSEPQTMARIAPLLNALNAAQVADEQVTVCLATALAPARMAVDLAIELGTW